MSDLTTLILLGIIIFLFIFLLGFIIVRFFVRRKNNHALFKKDLKKVIDKNKNKISLEKNNNSLKTNNLYASENNVNKLIVNSNNSINSLIIDNNENQQKELKDFNDFLTREKLRLIKEFESDLVKKYHDKAIDILIEVMEKNAEKIATDRTTFAVKLEDDSIKGRIIGRDGRNKKAFENLTGTNIVIDPKEPIVSVSSPNPIRRELGKQLLEKLINSKNIEPNRIEKNYVELVNQFEQELYDVGKNTIEVVLGFNDINPKIYPYVGRLKYRTSYGQNNLNHCIECASLAVSIARKLNLDENKAKKAAFFHDIGKSLDFEISNDHVESGVDLAKKYGLEDYVINAIESHHEKVPVDNVYSGIVKIVDSLSAARPGARTISSEEYFNRIDEIEKTCKTFKNVKDCYALKAGKQVRIMVDAEKVDDEQLNLLVYEIKQALENNEIVNKQPIEIIAVREKRFIVKTSGTAKRDNDISTLN